MSSEKNKLVGGMNHYDYNELTGKINIYLNFLKEEKIFFDPLRHQILLGIRE